LEARASLRAFSIGASVIGPLGALHGALIRALQHFFELIEIVRQRAAAALGAEIALAAIGHCGAEQAGLPFSMR